MEEIYEPGKPKRVGYFREVTDNMPTYWQLPYRCMLPKDIPNLLICGRAIDADKGALAAARVMISLNQTGEAAGVAAAMTADLDTLDITALQKELVARGVKLHLEDVF